MLGPRLYGERISLQPARPEDLETFQHWFANLEVTRYLLTRFAFSAKQEEEWYQRVSHDEGIVSWRVVVAEATIGVTSIIGIDWINRQAMSGTIIGDRSQWGKGYGSEIVALRTRYAFDELGLERLETQSFAENRAMHRALEKAGYQGIGRRRHSVYRGGSWHDTLIFELLREEWHARQSP